MWPVLGAADACPLRVSGVLWTHFWVSHKGRITIVRDVHFAVCPRRSRCRTISKTWEPKGYRIQDSHFWDLTSSQPTQSHLISYRHRGYHYCQSLSLAQPMQKHRISGLRNFWVHMRWDTGRKWGMVCCLLLHTKHCHSPKIFCIIYKRRSARWRYFQVFIDQSHPADQLCLLLPRPGCRRNFNQWRLDEIAPARDRVFIPRISVRDFPARVPDQWVQFRNFSDSLPLKFLFWVSNFGETRLDQQQVLPAGGFRPMVLTQDTLHLVFWAGECWAFKPPIAWKDLPRGKLCF